MIILQKKNKYTIVLNKLNIKLKVSTNFLQYVFCKESLVLQKKIQSKNK